MNGDVARVVHVDERYDGCGADAVEDRKQGIVVVVGLVRGNITIRGPVVGLVRNIELEMQSGTLFLQKQGASVEERSPHIRFW